MTTGTNNVAVGHSAGTQLTTGSGNIIIGQGSNVFSSGQNITAIGTGVLGSNAATNNGLYFRPSLASLSGTTVVYSAASGQMGPQASSLRFKENVTDIKVDAKRVHELRPGAT